MDFATNFRRICQEKGTTPTKVCLGLGLSSSKVNMWNNGSLPKQPILVKLAEALECSVMDFFADEVDLQKMEFALDEDERDIIRLFRMLSRKEKHEFMTKAYLYEEKLLNNGED
jgi:transcriptional regulator with XRE-family HTH domain